MTLHRFFVPAGSLTGDRFALPDGIAHQVRTVLRLGDGDRIVLLPGDGSEALCRLEAGGCVIEERRPNGAEPRHRLTIGQALLKGDGLDEVVRIGTEVGVAEFRLIIAARCVVRDLPDRRLDRLRAIAREAAEQSERGIVPTVTAPIRLDAVLGPDATLLYERHDGERLGSLDPPPSTLLVGPEGGWDAAEVTRAVAGGTRLAGLGPRILRSQSVAAAAAAVVLSRTGDFA